MGHTDSINGHSEPQHNPCEQSLLSRLTLSHRERLLSAADEVTFDQEEVILSVGQPSKSFYLLTSGSVGVDLVAPYYSLRVQALGPGDAFGWSSLLDGCDTMFQVRARERCSALRFCGAALTAMCREDPEFGVELLRGVLHVVACRVLGAEAKLVEFCGLSERRVDRDSAQSSEVQYTAGRASTPNAPLEAAPVRADAQGAPSERSRHHRIVRTG
jgi:CRP-like cAMP-binding protein